VLTASIISKLLPDYTVQQPRRQPSSKYGALSTIEASSQITLYATFLAKIVPDICSQSFAVQHYFRINFNFDVWLQYRYVTAIHKLATLE
jgi:hypothetical protein